MIKVIELKDGYARLKDGTPVILPDELELQFKSVGYDLTHAFITLRNGETAAKFRLKSPFKVDGKLLYAGKLCGRIDAYLGDEVSAPYKTWDLLPIRIVETENGDIELFDQLTAIEEKIAVLDTFEERLKVLEDKHKLIK